MKLQNLFFLGLVLIGCPFMGVSKDFLEDRERGWYWFEEGIYPEDFNEEDKLIAAQNKFDANQVMEKLQKTIQISLNRAILIPTESNIQNYLSYQIKAFKMSERFTKVAKQVQVQNPSFDYQIEAPYNHYARIIKNQEERKTAENAVKKLAMTHGLFFFFETTCPYCVVMAPNVLKFAEKHGMHLIPISLDGGTLKEFPEVVRDNGMANAYGVTHLPALFAVNPRAQEVLKLANRVTSITELEDIVLAYQLYNQDNANGH